MYAIIEDGAHQYKVQEGDTLEVQRRDLPDGQATIEFDGVLMIGDDAGSTIGQPYVPGAKVIADIKGEIKGAKIDIIKFKRRKTYRRKTGHRQKYLRVTIKTLQTGS